MMLGGSRPSQHCGFAYLVVVRVGNRSLGPGLVGDRKEHRRGLQVLPPMYRKVVYVPPKDARQRVASNYPSFKGKTASARATG